LAAIQLQNHQNVGKKKQFWQKVPGVNGLKLSLLSYASLISMRINTTSPSLEKAPSNCAGQLDNNSHLPDGQGHKQVVCQLNSKKTN